MTPWLVPLQPTNQTLSVVLNGVAYTLRVLWNTVAGYWVMDMYDSTGINPVLLGVPLVTGCDLLQQFDYLGIGGELWVQTSNDPYAPPTFTNLGVTSQLFYLL